MSDPRETQREARPSLETLASERLEHLSQLRGVRWKHLRSGGEYIVRDVVLLEWSASWAVLYEPAGAAHAVPFVRPLAEFFERFECLQR